MSSIDVNQAIQTLLGDGGSESDKTLIKQALAQGAEKPIIMGVQAVLNSPEQRASMWRALQEILHKQVGDIKPPMPEQVTYMVAEKAPKKKREVQRPARNNEAIINDLLVGSRNRRVKALCDYRDKGIVLEIIKILVTDEGVLDANGKRIKGIDLAANGIMAILKRHNYEGLKSWQKVDAVLQALVADGEIEIISKFPNNGTRTEPYIVLKESVIEVSKKPKQLKDLQPN